MLQDRKTIVKQILEIQVNLLLSKCIKKLWDTDKTEHFVAMDESWTHHYNVNSKGNFNYDRTKSRIKNVEIPQKLLSFDVREVQNLQNRNLYKRFLYDLVCNKCFS